MEPLFDELHPYVSLKPLFEKKIKIKNRKRKNFGDDILYLQKKCSTALYLFICFFYSDDIISKTLNYINLIIYMLYITYF